MSDAANSPTATRPNGVLAVLLLAGLSFALSQTLVVPALPSFSTEYSASATASSWLLTGFLLSASVATPIVGKLGDQFGKGRVLTAVLVLFSTGSVVCALADSIGVVIAGRVIQGVAGGVFPLAFGIIRDTFPRERVPAAIGLLSAVFGIGGGIGLPLSGVIVDNVDVSWLFWVGLIGLPAALAAHRLVPASPAVVRTRIDWLGAALLSVALAGLLLGVTESNRLGWTSPVTVGLLVGGVVMLGVWTLQQSRTEQPLIELALLRRRTVAATNLTGLLVGFAMFSSFLLIPQFAQAGQDTGYGFGLSVTNAGLLLVPMAAAQLVAGPLAGRIGGAIGFRLTLAMGAGFATLAFVMLALEHSHPWHFAVGGVLLGAGISFALASMANLIVDSVPQSTVGIATGINTVTRTVGGAFGSAAATAILAAQTIGSSPIPSEGAYTLAFVVSAVGGLLAIAAALSIPPRARAEVAFDAEASPAAG
jgi:EmrB/QacA subfamily drug resistance transporter